jgi:type IV fimbrial biogenesis protein FimT
MSLARDVRGYTLLELLATLTIVGVLCSIAAPSFAATADRARARAAIDRVKSDLYWARVQAVRRGRSVTLRFQEDPRCAPTQANSAAYGRYTVLVADAAGPREIRAAQIAADAGKVCFEMNRSAELVFTSRGMLHGGQNRTLWARRGAATFSLRISLMGRVALDE